MSEAKESVETVAGCRVGLLRGGEGPPLLFLHGARGAGVWLPFMRRLAERFHVIVPEHPGFGRSETPEWLDNVGDLAFFYLDFIDALGLGKIHLVGNSMGGWIAAELAVRNTASLATLTLVTPACIHVAGAPKGDIFMWSREEVARNLFFDAKFTETMLAQTLSDEEQQRMLKNALIMAKLAWQPRLYDPHLAKWLHRINRPTLLIWGDADKVIPPAYGPAFRDLIPGARLEMFPRCGHLPHVERADAFAQCVIGFIDGARP